MASIQKISIRGVRSFSPDDQEQVVEFLFPLTIITGANGCGKTTIIESLKFALSGSMPPSGALRSAGQNFVSDPRSSGHTSVKASIKLRFTNKAGKGMVIVRSMELTQKKTTMQFKQLDGVIRTIDSETGERISLSHKCGELDKQMPSLMGVSKAIMDYVLFVHQEDSSWPLQEASVLKKRFDDIFDSTRYTKALESFRKTKKELTGQAKDIKAEVMGLASSKSAAELFRKDMDAAQKSLEKCEESIAESKKTIAKAKEDFAHFEKIVDLGMAMDEKITKKTSEQKNLESVCDRLRSMLEKDLTTKNTKEQLLEKQKDFDKDVKMTQQRQADLLEKAKAIHAEIEDLREQEMTLNSSKGKVAAEKEAHEKRLRERVAMMEKITQNYTLELQNSMTQLSRIENSFTMSQHSVVAGRSGPPEPPPLSEEDMASFFKTLEEKEKDLKDELKQHKDQVRSQEDAFNKAITDLAGNRNAFKNERTKIEKETATIDEELAKLGRSLGPKRMKKSVVDDARENSKKAADDLQNRLKQDKREQLNAEIRKLSEKVDQAKENIEAKQSIRARLKQSADLMTRVSMLEENLATEVSALKDNLREKADNLRTLKIDFPDVLPEDSSIVTVARKVNDSVDEKFHQAKRKSAEASAKGSLRKKEADKSQSNLQVLQQRLNDLEQRQTHLEQRDQSVGKAKRTIDKIASSGFRGFDVDWSTLDQDPQEWIDYLDNHLKQLESDTPADVPPETLSRLGRRLKKQGKKEGSCPCCQRGLTSEEQKIFSNAVKTLFDADNSSLVKGSDADMQVYREERAKVEGWRKEIQDCIPGIHEYKRCIADIADINDRKPGLEELSKSRKKDYEAAEAQAQACEQKLTELRDLQDWAKGRAKEANRIEEQDGIITEKREGLEANTANDTGNGTLEQVETDLDRLREHLDSYYEKITKSNKKVSRENEDISAAQERANRTLQLLRTKETKYEEENKAAEEKTRLEKRKSEISRQIIKLGEQIASLNQKINAKEAEKSRLYTHSSDKETQLQGKLQTFSSEIKYLRDISSIIDEYGDSGKEDSLDRIAAKVATVVEAIEDKKKALAELQPELDAVARAVDDRERHEKLLKDNIDLLDTLSEIDELHGTIAEMKRKREEIEGHETANEKLLDCEAILKKHSDTIARGEGRRLEIVEQIRGLNRKLTSPEFRDVDEKHRSEVIKHETTILAIKDLDNYASALDKALLRFHSIKIAEINKIVRELWLLTYKGEDITNIELESGQDSRAAKSYNYRVVMMKGGTRMDMRGRCSAGQRVLASIVIRLALAETFGVLCGCLVLDEPTVNLDSENRRGLAVAMAQIIAARSKQANFQLVLITHDEDFVSLMKDELSTRANFSMPEKYFQVRREESSDGKYYSKIDAIDWDELL